MFKQREMRNLLWKTALMLIFMLGVFSLRNTEVIGLQASEALFIDAPVSAVPSAQFERERQDPTIRQSRHVHVNLDLLKDPNASLFTLPQTDMPSPVPPHPVPVQTSSVTLNLFNNVSFTAVGDRLDMRSANRYTWYGHIVGVEQSHVILVNEDGDMAGEVFVRPGEQYQIRPAGGGVHAIYDVDTSAFLPEAEPIPVYTQDTSAPAPSTAACCDTGSVIDVMVVYTAAAAAASGNIISEIQLAVDQANTAYANSLISQRLRLVHTAQITYTETGNSLTDLERLQNSSDGYLDVVQTLRNTYHADVVSLYVESMTDACGIGYLMANVSSSFESWAFNVVDRGCATSIMAFAHELGHNMGAHHDRANAFGQGAYSYSYGYIAPDKKWRTVMAYPYPCSYCPIIPNFSNPIVTYSGVPTGIPEGQPDSADNAKTLNNTAYKVANFRQSADHSILGAVRKNGTGMGGVTMTLNGCASAVTVTAADGTYSFTGLADGSCTVTPSLSGYAFIPPSRPVTVAGADVTAQDFSTVQTWFEEDDATIIYTGAWNSLVCNPCKNGLLKYSGQTGAKAEFSFYGTGIKWHTAKASVLGKAKIYLNGIYKGMVDLYSPAVKYPLVLGGSGLPPDNYALTIEVSGQKNPDSTGYYTLIDALEVIP